MHQYEFIANSTTSASGKMKAHCLKRNNEWMIN